MLALRRCYGVARVLGSALGQHSPKDLAAAALANEAPAATVLASKPLITHRLLSQMPDAERILHGSPLEAHHHEDPAGAGAAAEESHESYGSGDQDVEEERQRLLEASLHHVAQLGWSQAALAAGAADVGLSPASAGILARGEGELVEYFMSRCNHELEAGLAARAEGLAGMGTTARVREGIRLRLEMNVPYINTWAQALALQARPAAAARALQQRLEIADTIWHAAGDKSTDFNWYTKRTLLLGAYSATELYMLTDASPDFADTWAALDRCLGDVLQLGKAVRGVASLAEEAGAVLGQLAGGLAGARKPGGQ